MTGENPTALPTDALRTDILHLRSRALATIGETVRAQTGGYAVSNLRPDLKASVYALYLCVRPMLRRRLPPEQYKAITALVESKEEEDWKKAFYLVDDELDTMGLLKVDALHVKAPVFGDQPSTVSARPGGAP